MMCARCTSTVRGLMNSLAPISGFVWCSLAIRAICASCGAEAKVPFEPRNDRPVYCSDCFAKMRQQQE